MLSVELANVNAFKRRLEGGRVRRLALGSNKNRLAKFTRLSTISCSVRSVRVFHHRGTELNRGVSF